MDQKVVIFDVDGALLETQMGALKDILVLLGRGKEVMLQDDEYKKHKTQEPWGLHELFGLYKGLDKSRIERVALEYCRQHLTTGAGEVVAELRLNDYLVGIISSEADFVINALIQLLSLDFGFGCTVEYSNDICTGLVTDKVDRFRKAEILRNLMNTRNYTKDQVIVIGDSIRDSYMGKLAGTFIGFNPKNEIRDKVTHSVDDKDLQKILPLIGL